MIDNGLHYTCQTTEWNTPKKILDAVLAVLGEIDLDPCSNSHENPNVPASVHYTKEDDGLSKGWNGRVFLNPPYGRDVQKWTNKLVNDYKSRNVTEAIVLVAARTDTKWFNRLGYHATCWCAVKGRLKFSDSINSAPFPSSVFYLGNRPREFCDQFYEIGQIWRGI